jgi:membrane protease YdiL (CAAX protease family)
MPGFIDVALVALIGVLWPLAEFLWLWPRHVRAVESGDAGARTRIYRRTLMEQWSLTVLVLARTVASARPLAALGLRAPSGWPAAIVLAMTLAYGILVLVQGRGLAAKPDALARVRARIGPVRPMLPHTPGEFRLFVALSCTAGICEELMFRGYMVWVLQAWLGLWPAVIASMVLFGFAHSYQGVQFGLRAFAAGVAMGVIVLATRSLLPAMMLHALITVGSGWVTHMALRSGGDSEPKAAVA